MKKFTINYLTFPKLLALVALAALVLAFGGCTKQQQAEQPNNGPQTAQIVMNTNNAPYTYQDAAGNPAGYDYEVLKLVDEYLTDWQFEYTNIDYETALAGVQSGKYDLVSGCYFRTPAREEAYLVSEPYNFFFLNLVVKNDSGITSLEDMAGKSIAPLVATDGRAVTLNDWIVTHPEVAVEFEPLASSGAMADEITQVEDGVYDAAYLSAEQAQAILAETNYTDLTITDVIGGRDTVFLYNKQNAELQTAVNEAIEALTADGTLGELTQQWFDQDNFAKAAELGLR